ncbi:hypothetical protein PACTADRAFT_50952 [Pachysolen tannophilus NRRL Y-2460]|uniref:Replication factor A protein 3 n=1 Tax=Pachysolen tannophilus NRRL Y-2460 TaxID=669874 RepID=A0A1E4TQR7_PACTA|nr:hypothetical protein PACTADRAFT_50952 [Pachysolen tannophilus NRRL Y-2460]
MDSSLSNIRVDHTLLKQFEGKVVRVIGKLGSIQNDRASLLTKASDGSSGQINLLISSSLVPKLQTPNNYYEVIGKITNDELAIRVLDGIDFGDSINEKAAIALVKYSNKCSELFY